MTLLNIKEQAPLLILGRNHLSATWYSIASNWKTAKLSPYLAVYEMKSSIQPRFKSNRYFIMQAGNRRCSYLKRTTLFVGALTIHVQFMFDAVVKGCPGERIVRAVLISPPHSIKKGIVNAHHKPDIVSLLKKFRIRLVFSLQLWHMTKQALPCFSSSRSSESYY